MIPFIEPRVIISSLFTRIDFDKLALKMGLTGYCLLGLKFEDINKESNNQNKLLCVSRREISSENVNQVRDIIPKERNSCEILSILTSNEKVAQWVVKDNRVDILSIPFQKTKDILTRELANVAAQNRTFIELDIGPIFRENEKKSYYLRILTRVIHEIIKEKAPLLLSCNINNPYEFKDMRTIISLGELIGVPEVLCKASMKELYDRILMNREKLMDSFVNPGIWKNRGEIKKEIIKGQEEEYSIPIPENLSELVNDELKLERQRYLFFELISDKPLKITQKQLESLVWGKYDELFGAFGSSRSGLFMICYDDKTQFGILRCNHRMLKITRIVLASITKIENQNVAVQILKVSGTLRKFMKQIKK